MTPPRTQWRVVATAIGAAALLAASLLIPIRPWLSALALWARGAGGWGLVGFALAQVTCTLVGVPAWPLRVAAGFVWGFVGGFALALPTSLLGSLLAFAASRTILRERVAERVAREPRLRAIDGAVGASGFWIVLLLRLSPVVPNELVNYGLGLTRVRLRDYAVGSLLGMVPLTATYVAAGSLVTAAGDLALGRPQLGGAGGGLVAVLGFVATVAVAVMTTRLAQRALGPVNTR